MAVVGSPRDAAGVQFSANPHDLSAPLRAALALMLQSHDYAQQCRCSPWDFGVEVVALREVGLTRNDMRWLACTGLVEHAREITHLGDDRREFRPTGRWNLTRRSCFILTERGVEVARRVDSDVTVPASKQDTTRCGNDLIHWDCDRRQLRVTGELVKEFRLPSPNQEAVLQSFQRNNWPVRIGDPLPVVADGEPRQRLRDTIKSLNRNHKCARIRFKGDGTGQGVVWELL